MENILRNISRRVADWSCGTESADQDKREIVAYGIEIQLETYIKMVLFFIIALLTGTLPETFVIFFCFCGLRRFAGGKHLKTSLGCFGASALVWLAGMLSGRVTIPLIFLMFGMIVSLLICWKYAPVDTENNPITDPVYRKKRKIMAAVMTAVALIIVLIIKDDEYRNYIAVPIMIEAVTLLLGKK